MKKLLVFVSAVIILSGSFWIYLEQNYATPIIAYHSLDKARIGSFAAVDPEVFRKQMEFIKSGGYRVIPLSEYCQLLKDNKPVPRNLVVITFDDGYKDNLQAVEILKDFDFPATIFLIVEGIDHESYLSRKDITTFLKNSRVNIGSHTLTHAYLPSEEDSRVEKEIRQSKRLLEEYFHRKIDTIAYPIGGFNQRVLKRVKESGYLCACSTNRGFSKRIDRFALRRIKITNRDLGFRLGVKLSGFYNAFKKPKKPY